MSTDSITIRILNDGTIKTDIDGSVSMPNHANAEAFLRECARAAGGKREVKHKHGHAHTHTHGDQRHHH